MKVKRALLSVFRKDGIVDLARELTSREFEIVSTGGTAAELRKGQVAAIEVAKVTGFPEILDGRVKTLHPKIHAGILARRGVAEHEKALADAGIAPIDVVVVNLYPFEDKVAKGAPFDEAVENIDVGGPSMLRSAAKNFKDVAVVVDPADYPLLLEQLDRKGGIDAATRLYFAQKAFRHSARYEAAIAAYFSQVESRDDGIRGGGGGGRVPLSTEPDLREGAGPALRGEPAPAGGLLQRPRVDPLLGGGGAQGPGQGALVQQHPRPRRGLAPRHRDPRPGLRDHQAHEPLRHRPGPLPWRPGNGRGSATPPPPSGASSPSTARWTWPRRRRSPRCSWRR